MLAALIGPQQNNCCINLNNFWGDIKIRLLIVCESVRCQHFLSNANDMTDSYYIPTFVEGGNDFYAYMMNQGWVNKQNRLLKIFALLPLPH